MARYKMTSHKSTIKNAVEEALNDLTGLAEEIREVVDNAEGGLANTPRIQTLGETADTLDGINEPEIDGAIGDIELEYTQSQGSGRRGLSRSARRDNAVSILDSCISTIQEKADALEEGDQKEELEGLVNELEDIKGAAEECEFPGMFG